MHAAYKEGENAKMHTTRLMVTAPVRIADIGGWTDTWFAGRGIVCNLAVGPGVIVEVVSGAPAAQPTLVLSDFGQRVRLDDEGAAVLRSEHPVLAEILHRHLDPELEVAEIRIRSAVPPGSSLGTSAAVGVAAIGALEAAAGRVIDAQRIAELAHAAETGAGLQSGVQDHAAAAFGGVSEIHIDYPSFAVTPLSISEYVKAELSARLRTVFLGRHDSSTIHRMVIQRLQSIGNPESCAELSQLRAAASDAVTALRADDLCAYGEAMLSTVEAQRGLHPDLISPAAQLLVDLACSFDGAAKINGAGGFGGSVTLLAPENPEKRKAFEQQLTSLVRSLSGASLLPLELANSGVAVVAN
jgi:D-glycero-alpha-D-manno-heptose-7-phosphate kinase